MNYQPLPPGAGPCAKQTVTAIVTATDGTEFRSTNYCLDPQMTCAREGMPTGVGYELCKSVCRQSNHAEMNAILFAGDQARGAKLTIIGHTYACELCRSAAEEAGIVEIQIGV